MINFKASKKRNPKYSQKEAFPTSFHWERTLFWKPKNFIYIAQKYAETKGSLVTFSEHQTEYQSFTGVHFPGKEKEKSSRVYIYLPHCPFPVRIIFNIELID